MYKEIIFSELKKDKVDLDYVLPLLEKTVQSGILYDGNKRKILFDLKTYKKLIFQ